MHDKVIIALTVAFGFETCALNLAGMLLFALCSPVQPLSRTGFRLT
jgi:hypothetical protein